MQDLPYTVMNKASQISKDQYKRLESLHFKRIVLSRSLETQMTVPFSIGQTLRILGAMQ